MGTCGWVLQAKEERLAEEKAKKKAAAKKMEEVEARRKQEEEARRLRWLQQVRAPVGGGAWERGGGAEGRHHLSPKEPCAHLPHRAEPTGSCYSKPRGDSANALEPGMVTGGGQSPASLLCRGSTVREKCMDSGARLQISALPFIIFILYFIYNKYKKTYIYKHNITYKYIYKLFLLAV